MNLKELNMGGMIAKIPIIQGGMGIGVSLSGLAGAVAREGGVGVISAAQPGYMLPEWAKRPLRANLEALAQHIGLARKKKQEGLVGVNIMCAARNYEDYVKCAVDSEADVIISGAGLPINLPELVSGAATKVAPIVSSVKAAKVLLKLWDKRYGKTADMVVVEGPKAGGHLGFSLEELEADAKGERNFDDELTGIMDMVGQYENKYNRNIPVVFGGGVYDRQDILRYIGMGCAGVQMATRFVVTEECDASDAFKQAYIQAKKEDIGIVKSPVGMPGRAITNRFVRNTNESREPVSHCYACLSHCDSQTTPYCISQALVNAVKGDLDNGLIFCGDSAHRVDRMTTVRALFKELSE